MGYDKDRGTELITQAGEKLAEYSRERLGNFDITYQHFFASTSELVQTPGGGADWIPAVGLRPVGPTLDVFEKGKHEALDYDNRHTLSWEHFGELDADVVFILGVDPEESRRLVESDPRWQDFAAVQNDRVFFVNDEQWKDAPFITLLPSNVNYWIENFGDELTKKLSDNSTSN